jgi:hypothetical protein
MNKKILLLSLFLSCTGIFLFGQNHDHVWVLGYTYEEDPQDSLGGRSFFDFSTDPPGSIYDGWEGMRLSETNASICNSEGELLFYSNGIYVADRFGNPMLGSDGLNPGEFADEFESIGYISSQGAIVLPHPTDSSLYYLVHSEIQFPDGDLVAHGFKFYYTLIDMSALGGIGAVVEKNVEIINDTLDIGKISAVKHANGRDWWIIAFEYETPNYYSILLDPNGFQVEKKPAGLNPRRGLGGAVFAPDGTKYARYALHNLVTGDYLSIWDFDPCTGELSNGVQDTIIDYAIVGGVAISPNSRFLYVSSYQYVYQYDLYASDVLATKDTVAIYDGFIGWNPTRFFMPQLGPNGKIYISATGSNAYLHVIDNPNQLGEACNVNQHGVELATGNHYTIPNFPNYRLGALEGSPCDTLSVSTADKELRGRDIFLFPNPTENTFIIKSGSAFGSEAIIDIYNAAGTFVKQIPLRSAAKEIVIPVSSFPSGMYYVRIILQGQVVRTEKVIVQK